MDEDVIVEESPDNSALEEMKAEKERLETVLAEREEELVKKDAVLQEKTSNFAALRSKVESGGKLKTEIDDLKAQIQKVSQANVQEVIDEYIVENIQDKDDQKRFDEIFSLLSSKASNKAEIKKALGDSKFLLDKEKGRDIDTTGQMVMTHGNPNISRGGDEFASEARLNMAKKLGISKDDIDKYKDKVKNWETI